MDYPSTTFTTPVPAYTESDTPDYSDYDTGSNESTGMCDRKWVREFRGQVESPLFWSIFIIGAVGNMMVVWIYTTVRNRLKTMTDVYLLNLAVADLLFLCMLPFWAIDGVNGWNFGKSFCKMVSAVYKINFFSSMFLLTCISVDRYIAIVQVTKAHNLKRKRLYHSKLACLGVWSVSAILALPEFIFAQVKQDLSGQTFCALVYWNNTNNRTKILVLSMQICMGFCLPLLVMFFCYSVIIRTLLQAKNFKKHKALRVIFAVVFVFVLSQLPYNSLLIVEAMQAYNTTITDCATVTYFDIAGQVTKTLAFTHACLNPFLYAFIGIRFRQDLFRIVRMCLGKGGSSKTHVLPKRPSVISDTDTLPALSI
ncbi:C-C chemokine receptor type 9-like [Seriola lalandi dorsalis]|uniref:C-C motif chemokine receptor 9 n=1 Tax=Seriola lalandi dorsalis TaxID=1841481 RepID=A0A3B4YWW4_SERLL|nr:C-C chemokine receptor type 9-like [Seriola lalandi dorsalis]XP_056220849.1 C-C chemokine receptor type 9-like [Seriola aureovittata]XP_056220850.1 C-C chemokine receptor type 9-like [Seriola aureovittata]XP_056220852.1 C-C chemokine receptor type 9-like [Seriola aureovittata]